MEKLILDVTGNRCNQPGHIARKCTTTLCGEIPRRFYPRERFRREIPKNYFKRNNFYRKLPLRKFNFGKNQNSLNSESSDSENHSENMRLIFRNDSQKTTIFNESTSEGNTSRNCCVRTD